MIYALKKEIETLLAAKGCPYPVVYGPERGTRMQEPHFVIERDRNGSDVLDAPRSRTQNPVMIGVRWQACTCTIFARSTLPGAGVHDHEREADRMVDAFTVALHKAVRARNNLYRITSAKFPSTAELALLDLEWWQDAVYRIEFAVDRAVNDVTWAGAKKATAVSGSVTTELDFDGPGVSADLPKAETELS